MDMRPTILFLYDVLIVAPSRMLQQQLSLDLHLKQITKTCLKCMWAFTIEMRWLFRMLLDSERSSKGRRPFAKPRNPSIERVCI